MLKNSHVIFYTSYEDFTFLRLQTVDEEIIGDLSDVTTETRKEIFSGVARNTVEYI